MTSEELTAALQKHKPTDVLVFQGEELTRTVKVPTNRKKWSAVCAVVAKLQWDTLELRARGGDVLAIIEAPTAQNDNAADTARDSRDERLLKLLISAQREALTYRERESAAALAACVQVMSQMVVSMSTLQKLHDMQLRAVATTTAATLQHQHQGDDDGELEAMKMLKQIAPMLLAKVMAPPAVAPPAAPKNANPTPSNGASKP
jgi:hypothetical protein